MSEPMSAARLAWLREHAEHGFQEVGNVDVRELLDEVARLRAANAALPPVQTAEWVSLPVAEHAALLRVVEAARALTNAVCQQWRAVATGTITEWERSIVEAAGDALIAILDLDALDSGAGEAAGDA